MATITVRVDEKVKKEAEELFHEMGLNMSTAMNIFLKRCIFEEGITFELKVLNKKTLKALEDVNKGKGLSKEFNNIKELMEDLNA